jgi:hypothetical protein
MPHAARHSSPHATQLERFSSRCSFESAEFRRNEAYAASSQTIRLSFPAQYFSRSLRLAILPVSSRGSSVAKSIVRGHL